MKSVKSVITVRLDKGLKPALDRFCRRSGRSRSAVIRDAIRRHLRLMAFEGLRRRTMPFAEARGLMTDDDIFKLVS